MGLIFFGIMIGSLFYMNSINENYYKQESANSIKSDILELGYSIEKLIVYEGIESSLNILYKSLATNKEYETLSIVIDNIVILSTNKKLKNMTLQKGIILDNLTTDNLYKPISFYHQFRFFDKGEKQLFHIVVDLDVEYLTINKKEIMRIMSIYLVIFILFFPLTILLLYKLNISPLVEINKQILKNNYSQKKFFFNDYTKLFNSFRERYLIAIELNKTLEEKVQQRTKSLILLTQNLEETIEYEVEKNKNQQLLMLHQSRLAQMGEMISMIAHQWRQPLNSLSILNNTVILKYKINKLDNEVMDYFKENSSKQIKNMSETINDFRNFFKPEKQKVEFCINDIILNTIDMIKPIFANNKIDIIFDKTEDINLIGFPNELGQAVLNIINNAKDALVENNIDNKKIKISIKI